MLKFIKILDSREIEPVEIFNLCDIDNSGTISLSELERYLFGLKVGFQKKEIHAIITKLDADKSGDLTLEEFKKHLERGMQFFQQESITKNNATMAFAPTKTSEIPGFRDLLKNLEIKCSALLIIEKIRSYPNSEIQVTKFYEEINLCFDCKLNKQQSIIFSKVISLSNTGMISIEKIEPIIIFYSSRSLSTRENYLARIKMHIETNENKLYDRKEMSKD